MKRIISVFLAAAVAITCMTAEIGAASDFAEIIEYMEDLEEAAREYAAGSGRYSAEELILIYIRTGNSAYNDSLWNLLAGGAVADFEKFVLENAPGASRLKELRTVTLPGGESTDISHMFAAMNMIYKGYGDLGGWIGDICDLMYDISELTGSEEELLTAAGSRFRAFGRFGIEDWNADMDAYNIMLLVSQKMSVSQAMINYFSEDLSESERCVKFIRSRLGEEYLTADVTAVQYRKAVLDIYQSDMMVSVLESARGLKELDAHRKAACCAVADHLFDSIHAKMPSYDDFTIDYYDETLYFEKDMVLYSLSDPDSAIIGGGYIPLTGGELYCAVRMADPNKYSYIDSEIFELKTPERPAPPLEAPVLTETGVTHIAVQPLEGLEYSIDGENWDPSGCFTDLVPASRYSIYCRKSATDSSLASLPSEALYAETPSSGPVLIESGLVDDTVSFKGYTDRPVWVIAATFSHGRMVSVRNTHVGVGIFESSFKVSESTELHCHIIGDKLIPLTKIICS